MEITKKVLGLGAVAAIAFACWMPAQSNAATSNSMQANATMPAKHHGRVKCYGLKKCQNMKKCGGKGYKMMSERRCMKKGGSTTEPKASH